ncbi:MAG TPA: response regulator [Chloroflexota bacterium]
MGATARRRRVVLVVDDDPAFREVMSVALALPELADLGPVRVLTAPDAAVALAAMAGRVPDLVLLDVLLEDADGLELCRRLRADPRLQAVPVVAMSGLGARADTEARARAAGCDDYLAKPFPLTELVAATRRWLRA